MLNFCLTKTNPRSLELLGPAPLPPHDFQMVARPRPAESEPNTRQG